jgi:hypothetical protein
MKNPWILLTASIGALFSSLPAHAVSDLGNPIDSAVIVRVGDLEWVWAAPCATVGESCGVPVLRDNFSIPTDAQWLSSFSSNSSVVTAFNNNGALICAAAWFSTVHNHCDYQDLVDGFVWHAPFPIGNSRNTDPAAESFLVRSVPEPEPYAMLLAGIGFVAALARRRKYA